MKNRSKIKSLMEKALWRDDFACRCCGFKSSKFQRPVPFDASANTICDSSDEFLTLCSFCELCFSLDQAGMTGGGVLIWLPEMSQTELNHLMRAIYAAQTRKENQKLSDAATRLYDSLLARRVDAKKRLGSDDPLLLATVFHENMKDDDYAKRDAKLEGIRLMPMNRFLTRGPGGDVNHFPKMLEYWTSPEGPFANFDAEKWAAVISSASSKVGG